MINLILSLSIMFCDIKGEVNNPGVYPIKNNNIYEVINLAGGLTKKANITNINLSKKVFDEMVIYIPSINDKPKSCPKCICPEKKICPPKEEKTTIKNTTTTTNVIITTTIPTTTVVRKVNINTAPKEELMTISGIGEVIADNIINYRNIKLFDNVEELKEVKGIGEVLFAKIKNFITV